jgi:hypothetical protein
MSKLLWKLNLTALSLLGVSLACALIVRSGAKLTPTVLAEERKPSVLKLIETWPTRTEPVTVRNIRVGNERIRPASYNGRGHPLGGTPFQGDENWLGNVSFTLRNRTSKVVTHLIISVGFPEVATRSARGVWVPIEWITKHTASASPDDSDTPTEVPFQFAPSSEFRVSLGDYLSLLQQRLGESQPLSSINTVVISVYYVCFEEGPLSWSTSNGYCLEPDGIRGGGCHRMEDTFFPGVLPSEPSKFYH